MWIRQISQNKEYKPQYHTQNIWQGISYWLVRDTGSCIPQPDIIFWILQTWYLLILQLPWAGVATSMFCCFMQWLAWDVTNYSNDLHSKDRKVGISYGLWNICGIKKQLTGTTSVIIQVFCWYAKREMGVENMIALDVSASQIFQRPKWKWKWSKLSCSYLSVPSDILEPCAELSSLPQIVLGHISTTERMWKST